MASRAERTKLDSKLSSFCQKALNVCFRMLERDQNLYSKWLVRMFDLHLLIKFFP